MKQPIGLVANCWRSTIVDSDVILKDYRPSKNYDCFLQASPSTPSSDNLTDCYETSSSFSHLNLHYDSIKLNLEELSRTCSSEFKIPAEIEWHQIIPENLPELFKNANHVEINISFLWAAFLKRHDLLEGLIKLGAQLSFYEHYYGLSALHLVAYSGCVEGTRYLLTQKGCYVNLMCKCYSPLHCAALGGSARVADLLLEKGANIDAFTNDLHCNLEGVLHCAVRANSTECTKIFCEKGANINQLDSSGRTPVHLAAELGQSECLKVLIDAKGVNIDQQTKEKLQTALHYAALRRHPDCVEVLLNHGATANIRDYRHYTPLHLAAKNHCHDSVKLLLKKGKANPNLQDTDQRTALHLTVAKSNRVHSSDTIKTLIRYGADVNAKDSDGYTPLHLAARHELPECVETLILCDADITAKCKPGFSALGIISRKTPSSVDAVRKKLDESIVFNHNEYSSKQVELHIDFNTILQHNHPGEIAFLATLLDEGQKDLLLHPVCTAFLHLKWQRIRKFFVFRAICCFILVLALSAYVLMGVARNCYNFSKNITVVSYEQDANLCLNHSFSGYLIVKYPLIVEIEWYIMVIFAIGFILRRICSLIGYSSFTDYMCTIENLLDWATIFTVFLISFAYTERTYVWQNHVSAFGVLIAWTNFLYVLGQFPFFGTYIAMYSSVQREFAKLLLVFSCLLIGFTISFCVLFPESEVFSTIYIGFITVLVMAIGEMNLELVTRPDAEYIFVLKGSSEIIYAAFVTCVTIILLNLLVGIVVHDIQGLKRTAKLTKIVKTTKLISCIERAFYGDYFHRKVFGRFSNWAKLVANKGQCTLNVKIYDHRHQILPRDVLQAACEVASKHKRKHFPKIQNNLKTLTHNKNISTKKVCKLHDNSYCWMQNDLNELRNDITQLYDEVIAVRNMLEANQRLVEQTLRVVHQNNEN